MFYVYMLWTFDVRFAYLYMAMVQYYQYYLCFDGTFFQDKLSICNQGRKNNSISDVCIKKHRLKT